MSRCAARMADGRQCVRDQHWRWTGHDFAPRGVELAPVVDQPDAERLFPYVVQAAAGGRCETAWTLRPTTGWVCHASRHDGHIAHTLFPNDLEAGIYDPARAIWICWAAHDWIFTNPADAHQCGLLNPDITA